VLSAHAATPVLRQDTSVSIPRVDPRAGGAVASFVGRRRELRRVAAAVGDAAAGSGVVLSISGEPGIGKSQLARKCLELARSRGFLTLIGAAGRFHTDLTYAPLLQALRPLVDATDPSRRDQLIAGLDDLSRLFDGLPFHSPDLATDPGLEHSRLFEAVCQLVQRAAERQPVALLIDDVHWADHATLDLVGYLALTLADQRLLIVTTDRGDPTLESIRRFRAPLRRVDRLIDLRLAALESAEVATLAAETLGGDPPGPLLELLGARARGVPLYVTAFIAALRDEGRLFRSGGRWVLGPGAAGTLPADVAEVIAWRLDELAARDLDVLAAIGVCGDESTPEMIAALLPTVDDLQRRLAMLGDAGLLDETVSATRITYRGHHPLVVDAAYLRLSARERRLRHAAAARHLLEGDHPDASQVAHHVRVAGPAFDRDRALEILTSAASTASAADAGVEAQMLAEAAAELVRVAGRDDLVPAALERIAEAATIAGDMSAAIGGWRDAAAAHGPGVAASRCLCRLALLQFEDGAIDDAARSLDDALDALPPDAESADRFAALQLRITFNARTPHHTRIHEDLQALRAAGIRAGYTEIAAVLDRYARAGIGLDQLTMPLSHAEMVTILRGIVNAADHALDPTVLLPWYRPWIVDAIARGDPTEAIRRAREVPELAQTAVLPGTRATAITLEGLASWIGGDWDRALRLTGESLVIAHRHANNRSIALALTVRGLILVHRGAMDQASGCVADARAAYGRGDRHVVGTIDTVAALLELHRGRPGHALAVLGRAGHVNYLGPLTLGYRISASVAAGEPDRLRLVADDLAVIDGPWAEALAERIRGLLAGVAGADQLARAAAALDALGLPFEAASARLELVEIHPSAPGAADLATAALAVFESLGAAPSADRARGLLRRLGHRTRPGTRKGAGLSERETQVAFLVAQGLSNAEVAARLFVSRRTVTTHLERIYRRLGISSRAELTRIVRNQFGDTYTDTALPGPIT
jgi:DNA-binding CsgD family transcriptional regulator/tetratricopeptide (TPR) repeat protein